MKKVLLFVLAVALVSVAAFAQQSAQRGNNDGGRGGKNGGSQTVCEKFDYPEIIHRPRCFESEHCKNFPKLRCETLYGSESHGRLAPCCWEGPQPSGGRGDKGNKGAKSEGPHYCEGQWANLPKCQGTFQNTTTLDKKCCWPIYYKGGNKGGTKSGVKSAVKTTPVKTPAPAVKGTTKTTAVKTTERAK